ncbi:udp-glucose 6-dehydrogenase [Prochlorococcus marinus str. MIT 9202]|nr:udp-glucose 6-dehydrogenase [Prochlorococcus marinus str. MIT 9202]
MSSSQISKELNQKEDQKELNPEVGFWKFSKDIYKAVMNADAVVLLTEWDEYKELDWEAISKKMRATAWVFDARSITNKKEIKKAGINFFGHWKWIYKLVLSN